MTRRPMLCAESGGAQADRLSDPPAMTRDVQGHQIHVIRARHRPGFARRAGPPSVDLSQLMHRRITGPSSSTGQRNERHRRWNVPRLRACRDLPGGWVCDFTCRHSADNRRERVSLASRMSFNRGGETLELLGSLASVNKEGGRPPRGERPRVPAVQWSAAGPRRPGARSAERPALWPTRPLSWFGRQGPTRRSWQRARRSRRR